MEYDYIYPLIQGVSIVVKNHKYGAVLSGGKILIEPRYDYLSNFNNGRSLYCINGQSGIIDLSGNIVVEDDGIGIYFDSYKYDSIGIFSGCKAIFYKDNKCGVIDKEGNVITAAVYDEILAFKDNVARVRKDDKWGLINTEGSLLCDIKYHGISNFFKNCALLYDKRGFIRGVINTCGKEIIQYNESLHIYPCPYNNIFFSVYNHHISYYDFDGNIVSKPQKVLGMRPSNWKCNYVVFQDNNHFGIKSETGQLILTARFSKISRLHDNYFEGALFPDFDEYELIDSIQYSSFLKKEGESYPHLPSWESSFSYHGEQILSLKNKYVTVPSKYHFAWPFCNGLAIVEKEGKWGVVDCNFHEIIPLKYDYIDRLNSDFYIGIINNICYIYNRNTLVTSAEYLDILPNNFFYIEQDNTKLVYDNHGINILQDIKIDKVINDCIFVTSDKNKISIMDSNFNEILSLPSGEIAEKKLNNDAILITYIGHDYGNKLMGIISSHGKLLVPFNYRDIFINDTKIIARNHLGEIKELEISENGFVENDYSYKDNEVNNEDFPYEIIEFT